MADTKISGLTALTGANVDPAADVLPIVDTSVTTTKKILVQELFNAASTLTALTGSGVDTAADSLPIYDNSATSEKKILVSELKIAMGTGITLGTEQATTSGTAIDFSSIPSGTKRIVVMFKGVSTNGTSNLLIQIGPSGGVETSGYLSTAAHAGTAVNSTAGFILTDTLSAANNYSGQIILHLENSSAFTWTSSGALGDNTSAAMYLNTGSKSAAAEVVKLRITTVNGTDAFDAGAINIQYEG